MYEYVDGAAINIFVRWVDLFKCNITTLVKIHFITDFVIIIIND